MRSLFDRYWKFEEKINKISSEVAICELNILPNKFEYFYLERLLIQLQVEFEQFVRGVILDSATGKFTNSAGRVSSPLFTSQVSREQASHKLISLYPKRSKEPDWYLPNDSIVAAQKLNLSNFSQIAATLGINPWTVNDLRYIRNFIAHQSKSSSLTIKANLPIAKVSQKELKLFCYSYNSNGRKNFEEWTYFIKYIAKEITV